MHCSRNLITGSICYVRKCPSKGINESPDPPDWISSFQESKTWDNVLLKKKML